MAANVNEQRAHVEGAAPGNDIVQNEGAA